MVCRRLALFALLASLSMPAAHADWPMWRADANRGSSTEQALPAELHLQWWKDLGDPQPAWPATQEKLQFDAGFEPVAAGGRIFVPSMIHDCLTAYASDSGDELWRFEANGPVRFAATCSGDAVIFGSDDGYVYCVGQQDGRLRWKLRGGPSDRQVLGNGRLISTWPVRGAPVVEDGVVYFAAGIWPFMGVFVRAVDVESGEVIWTNSGSGSNYLVQPHNSPAFAGVSPQGYLAVTNDAVIVPGGRGVPAGYDKRTGKFLFCHVGNFGKRAGGYDVVTGDHWSCNRGVFCCAASGAEAARLNIVAANEEIMLVQSGSTLTAYDGQLVSTPATSRDRRGNEIQFRRFAMKERWQAKLPSGVGKIVLIAGDRAFATDGGDRLSAVTLPKKEGQPVEISWQSSVPGNVWNMIAAGDRLLVTTREGGLFCFGSRRRDVERPAATQFAVAVEDTPSGQLKLIAKGATWKYLDDGSDQKTAWREVDFDDSAWKQGKAELGYGDGDEATTISFGENGGKKHITSYFRTEFDCDQQVFDAALLLAKVDDGAVLYINGNEVGRLVMPRGEVHFKTPATDGTKENDFQRVTVDPKLLQAGRNVIAVEVHQRSGGSSDVSFDLELLATPKVLDTDSLVKQAKPAAKFRSSAGEILKQTGQREGFCVVLGGKDTALVTELADHSEFQIVVLESDSETANALRKHLRGRGTTAMQVAVMQGDLHSAMLPAYLCNLMVASAELDAEADSIKKLFHSLRPYGGTAAIALSTNEGDELKAAATKADLQNARWSQSGGLMILTREGALPSSAPWTHQGAAVTNTMMSKDLRVKAPLGLLWFGGPSHEGVLPRHGHGPTPQVAGGRLFIEGRDFLRAVDVYTGRLLWQHDLPGVGLYYDNTGHHPGANAIGSNYVSLKDAVYVAYGRECLHLEPATGKVVSKFTLPKLDGQKDLPYFGYIGVYEDVLIAGSSPMVPWTKSHGVETGELQARFAEGSGHLVALDRRNGKVLWQRKAQFNFRHNAICAGGGKIFCIDRITEARLALLKRRGITPEGSPTLYAIDAKTGEVAWQSSDDIFGTWLTYSDEHDILIQATASFRDRALDEPDSGIAAYDAKTGKQLWANDAGYGGPVLLTGDRTITQGTAFDLHTGELATRPNPITGKPARWTFSRNYGCNTAIGCPNLLTFRSAAAGFYDLQRDGGTGNFGGFRSSCTSNLVPADGVLNAPDYTRTCVCSYQLQTSLALVHMPQAEVWTFQPMAWDGTRVRRIGINFGAPGDRRTDDKTLWVDYPSVGGRSPDLPIQIEGRGGDEGAVKYFRRHETTLGEHSMAFVAASGVAGARRISIKVSTSDDEEVLYSVKLIFACRPTEKKREAKSGAKFQVTLQGQSADSPIDLAVYSKSNSSPIFERTFRDVKIARELIIELSPVGEGDETWLSGVEIIQQ